MTATITKLPTKMVVTDDDARLVLACPVDQLHVGNEFGLTTILWDYSQDFYEDADPMIIYGVHCHECDKPYVDPDLLAKARELLPDGGAFGRVTY